MFSSISDLYSALSDLATEYPKSFGTISIGGILGVVWAFWRRPIINARLSKSEGSYAPVMFNARNEILIRYLSFRKLRKPGRRHKWEISGSGYRKRKFKRLEGDILAVCPDAFVLYRSRGGNSDWDGKYMIRKNARRLPPAEKIAYRLKVKFPSNPNYQIAPTTLAKQIQMAVGACERVNMIALADWQKLVQK